MASKLNFGERIIFRLIWRLLALGVGYMVYRAHGIWAAVGAGVAVWLLISVILGYAFGKSRVRKYFNYRRDFK